MNPKREGKRRFRGKRLTDEEFEEYQRKRTIVVHGLSLKSSMKQTEELLTNKFRHTGNIKNIRIPTNKKTSGSHRGYAFITYKKEKQARESMRYHQGGKLQDGSVLVIDEQVDSKMYNLFRDQKQGELDDERENIDSELKRLNRGGEHTKKKKKKRKKGKRHEPKDKLKDNKNVIFVRNLPFDVKKEAVSSLLERFGKIIYVSLVKNKRFGGKSVNSGSAFVRFVDEEGFKSLFQYLETQKEISGGQEEFGMGQKQRKKHEKNYFNEFYTFHDLKISGFVLHVSKFLSEKELGDMNKGKFRDKDKENPTDKRNAYLVKEGHIQMNTVASQGLHKNILKRLQEEYNARVASIKSNPNIHISRTRLRVTMIPKKPENDEKWLKALFLVEMKKHEEYEFYVEKYGEPEVKNVVILRPNKNKNIHSGQGFIEFTRHDHSLLGLRCINNNPNLIKGKRLFVSFALTNKTRLLKKEHAKKRRRNQKAQNIKFRPLKKKRKISKE